MTVSDRDIWLSAAQMIKAHGEEAWDEAVTRYFVLKEAGDHQGMATWAALRGLLMNSRTHDRAR
jgi:hypothetical protein